MVKEINIGEKFKQIRKLKGYTQEEVAEKLQFGARYISDLEREKTIGSIPTFVNLCNIYGVTPTYILQDYLNIKEDFKVDSKLVGFYSLDSYEQQIILNLIEFMNSKKNK